MKDGEYVSEALVYNSFEKGQINLVVADCGTGKSTAVYKTIPERLSLSIGKILVLIDTTMGRDSFVRDELAQLYDKEGFLKEKPTIMTYAMFGSKVKRKDIRMEDYEMIVCDEIHSMIKPVSIARGKLKAQYPEAFPWEINDMLSMTCFNYIAIEKIRDMAKSGEKWVFGLTATPANVYKIQQFDDLINEVKFSRALRAYEAISSYDYTDVEEILRQNIPDNRKRVFFFSTVNELQNSRQVLIAAGRSAEALWSLNHIMPMNEHQLYTREYLLENHKLPDDVQDLLFNSAYETAITIKDDSIKECYIHTANADTRVQARNRLRQDLDVIGYYDSSSAKNVKKAEKRKEERKSPNSGDVYVIPEEYLNIKLDKDMRDKLVEVIDFPKQWTSLKKWLSTNGYEIENKKIKGENFSIITKI